jgi:hypothetical protein
MERIQSEEGYGWEVREWWFEGGGGFEVAGIATSLDSRSA